ncbi:hypothetical protein NQ318_000468, partial [Aromia moschata]
MVYLTEMHQITILQMTGYGDRTRTQAEVARLFQEKYPELPPISQGITHECGFEDVTTEDVTQLLDVHAKPLSNQELEELMEELDNLQSENPEEEEEEDEKENDRRTLKTADLT